MKSMSWICRGRLGEYHYYCPSANVDSWYPQGLQSYPFQRALPISAGETSERLSRRYGVKKWKNEKIKTTCYRKFSLKRILVFDDTSLVSEIKAAKFRWEMLTTVSLLWVQTRPFLRCCWALKSLWSTETDAALLCRSNPEGWRADAIGSVFLTQKSITTCTGGDVCTCVG